MSETLHAEIASLHGLIAAISRADEVAVRASATGDEAPSASRAGLADEAAARLERLLARPLPVELEKRLEKIRKRLVARRADSPRLELARDLLELVDPLGRVGWSDELLARSLAALPGVGPKRAESFARRGLERISDLLFWLPSRYEDRRSVVGVRDLRVGLSSTFLAEVKIVDWASTRRGGRFGKIFQAVVGDDEAVVTLKWFRGGEALASQVVKGRWLLVSGEVKRYRFSKELIHPEIERVPAPGEGGESGEKAEAAGEGARHPRRKSETGGLGRIVPIYSAPEGMNPRTLRRLIGQSVEAFADLVEGHLPPNLVTERRLPDVPTALRALHQPEADIDLERHAAFASPAHERLVLEELYLLELGLAMRRARAAQRPGIAIDAARPEARTAAKALPFRLTGAQGRVVGEILADLARPHPMNRLLQGDVGSGKTAVAVLASVAVAACGGQTALMAPTELLAEQHCRTIAKLVESAGEGMPLRVGLLTASLPRAEIKALRGLLQRGEIDLVVGTHALVQGDIVFRDLVLSIVDEQHRFGVMQRAALSAPRPDGRFPHRLVMTATPIPRSLAMTLYGELDLSVIDELPPGRKPIETLLFRSGEGQRVMELIRETLTRGEQVYVVYPLVEESEKLDLRSAIESSEQIARAFPDHRVGLVHGRLDAALRQATMDRFATGQAAILVATTVIEVGVDVPNATLMVIEHAERFGLAQLHQLRGRVGRGGGQGRCVMVARGSSEKSEMRLRAMTRTTDGFKIADADLEIRGPGDFLGTRQSGHLPELRIADLLRDTLLVAVARNAAREAVESDPKLGRAPATRRAVRQRWGKRIELSTVG
ncbi:MAG: ATP-dependent DNA helicase RecG [Deltaproteobacteria bacterium]|nr:ATP-dependent DNA helicase RecG [Deltaproteobacteria bacterium]